MKIGIRAAVVVVMAVPVVGQAFAQTTGVSHPENVPITTSPEGIQQPVIYAAPLAAKPSAAKELQAADPEYRPAMVSETTRPVLTVQNPDAMVVGDDGTTTRSIVRNGFNAESFHPDIDAGIVTRIPGGSNELPIGTLMKVRMAQALTTKGTREGSEFTAELTEAVERDGRVLLPAGSMMSGRVTDVHGGRRISGAASIHLQPVAVTLPDGTKYKIYGQVVDTDRYKKMKVDSEGTIKQRDHKAATAAALGLSTGSGMAAGAVFGGWPGALVGGAVGAGIGTAVWLKQDRQTELPAGTKIVISLTTAMAIGTE